MHNLKLFASLSFPVINREKAAIVCQEFAHFLRKVLQTNFKKGGKIWGRFVQKPVIHIHVLYMAFIPTLSPSADRCCQFPSKILNIFLFIFIYFHRKRTLLER
jgi:hypothetical protein